MMRTASEKLATICLVEESELSVRRTLDEIKISRTSFYRWCTSSDHLGPISLFSKRHFSAINPNCGEACVTSGCAGTICENH
jgi:hypothetical protein